MTARKQVFILINRFGTPTEVYASPIDALDRCARLGSRPKVKGQRRQRVHQVLAFPVHPVNPTRRRELTKLADRLRVAVRRAAAAKRMPRKTRKRTKR